MFLLLKNPPFSMRKITQKLTEFCVVFDDWIADPNSQLTNVIEALP